MIYISTVAGGRAETNRTGQSSNILLSPSNQMVVTTQQVWSKYFILDKKSITVLIQLVAAHWRNVRSNAVSVQVPPRSINESITNINKTMKNKNPFMCLFCWDFIFLFLRWADNNYSRSILEALFL